MVTLIPWLSLLWMLCWSVVAMADPPPPSSDPVGKIEPELRSLRDENAKLHSQMDVLEHQLGDIRKEQAHSAHAAASAAQSGQQEEIAASVEAKADATLGN